MTLAIMSHHHHHLPSSHMCTKPRMSPVKNHQVLFESSSTVPVIKHSAHPDLQRISSKTLCSLLVNDPDDLLIIDARYPFEYTGGHILSAENIYTEHDLRLFFNELINSTRRRPSIIVFHCEFSSERGPRLCRLFRSLDRQYHLTDYPQLSFPSIYLLDGGYAQFYENCKEFCQPIAYVSMFEQKYHQELQNYRRGKKIANGRMTKNLIEQQGPIQFCMS